MHSKVAVLLTITLAWCLPLPSQSRKPSQAKTQPEYNDYNAAYAIAGGAAIEKAANDFASKYPASELRAYLFSKALHEYQNENNPTKMLVMGEKVLALDSHNAVALVLTSTVLADSLSDTDTDREQKITEIKSNASNAIRFVDEFTPTSGATSEQIAAYKSTLQSMAHSALGIMELKIGEDSSAEDDLKKAATLNTTKPDPYIWYHLALSQDHQRKYAEALASVEEALKNTSSNPDLEKLARSEHARLLTLIKS
jgi:tetratricopeptide (TPR) repeat protein